MSKKALITGITGQDGSYLAEVLLSKGYEVHGMIRRSSSFNTERIDHIYQDPHIFDPHLKLFYGDLNDVSNLNRMIEKIAPDEIYNLGAQSHVRVSFDIPDYTVQTVGMGTLHLLEAIRETQIPAKFYQAGSSEMFGASPPPQSEKTPFHPRSPYACAKVLSHHLTINYREAYHLFACNGILFNHESPRRGETFVTRKITQAAARIKLGKQKKLYLGNLQAKRDWGYAKEYAEAMWLILQQPSPDDFVIATGRSATVEDFVNVVFSHLKLSWKDHIEIDPRYYRPAEVEELRGDASKAFAELGWHSKMTFEQLAILMVEEDLKKQKDDRDQK